jgi:hypothetical protein
MSDHTTPHRQCTKCGKVLPVTSEYFYRHKRGLYGFFSYCKLCAERAKGRNPLEKPPKGMKRCTRCHLIKPSTNEFFNKRADTKTGLTSFCKECRRNARELTKDRDRERMHVWYLNNQDYVKARTAEYARANTERLRELSALWRSRNRTKVSAITSRRRARKRFLPDTFTSQDWGRALNYWHGCCAICGAQDGFWNRITADHWIPLNDPSCPGTVPLNMVPLCRSCNSRKRYTDPAAWLRKALGKKAAAKLQQIEAYFEWVRSQSG